MSLITKERFIAYARLIRLDKPIGTLLLLWPTLWGIWLAADGMPDGMILLSLYWARYSCGQRVVPSMTLRIGGLIFMLSEPNRPLAAE